MKKRRGIPSVYRISVDERLSDDLIRLEICELVKWDESGEFKDKPDYWRDIYQEKDLFALPNQPKGDSTNRPYTELMWMPESVVDKFPWKDLTEGQVFLSGEFVIQETQQEGRTEKRYFINPGERAFIRIDEDVKDDTKALYFGILAKGDRHG
jgi:hypothetical protein